MAFQHWIEDPRLQVRRAGEPDRTGRCVVYWMQRAQRGVQNHALNCAIHVANTLGLPVVTYFAGISNFPHANLRHYHFLQQGLLDVEQDLAERNVGFVLRNDPKSDPLQFFHDVRAAIVVGDENPLRAMEQWRQRVAAAITVPYWTVDADVVVPTRMLEKAQFAARTMRPRLKRMHPEFLVPIEDPKADTAWSAPKDLYADTLQRDMTKQWGELDRSVLPVEEWAGGARSATRQLSRFTRNLLEQYDRDRNRPEMDHTSMLSPYLHYGHISPITIALAVQKEMKRNPGAIPSGEAYLDQLLTWRELCINFVTYHPHYDTIASAEPWARTTILEHMHDHRPVTYTIAQLEKAQTHDALWNAAQQQMVQRGWMHNYVRMYWGKKILEWSPSVKAAMQRAIYLNDKYQIDGRDPNGYGNIAWCLVGKFDRAWNERPIFGKIRYMSGESTGRKFDSKRYIANNSSHQGGFSF